MRLRSLTKHIRDQNWFAVALDFVIVVVGVGVALLGQQALSDRQQRAEMERVAPTVRTDLGYNYGAAKERLSLVQCRVERYQEIAAKLLATTNEWTGIPFVVADAARKDEFARKNALPLALRTPSRGFGSRTWEAEMARGTFNQMDDERRSLTDRIFDQGRAIEVLQDEIAGLQGEFSLLAVSTTISASDRQRYYNLLGKIDDKSTGIETMARQLIEAVEDIGFDGPPQDAAEATTFLAERNEIGAAIYGACYQPQTWPYFEAITAKAATAEVSTP